MSVTLKPNMAILGQTGRSAGKNSYRSPSSSIPFAPIFVDKMKTPMLYPCANRVKMPHVGADETDLTPQAGSSNDGPVLRAQGKLSPGVSDGYVKRISTGLEFSEDVVRQRCFHTLPYDQKYFKEVIDPSSVIPQPPKSKQPVGRHNARGSNVQHLPCHIKKRDTHRLKPMKRRIIQKAVQMHQEAMLKEYERCRKEAEIARGYNNQVFITEAELKEEQPTLPNNEWDEYLMSILSETTARWIINTRVPPGEQQEKLKTMLDTYYGVADEDDRRSELFRDDLSEGDPSEKIDEGQSTRRWKRNDETLLDRVKELQKELDKPTDPYADDNAAAFYRLPAGFRRAQRNKEKEEAGACNTTAYNISIKGYEPPPAVTLRDMMNPEVGKTLFDTKNQFQQEWLTGKNQVHQIGGDQNRILMGNNNKYRKQLQVETPQNPEKWFPQTEDEKNKKKTDGKKVKVFERGMHRWKSLPEPIDDTAEILSLVVPGDSTHSQSPDPNSRKAARENSTLVQIVDDWRNKWNLDMRYADANPDDLIRDMADNHIHIRLKAITTCARAAEYRPPPEPGIQLEKEETKVSQVKLLPEKLFIALECCLDGEHEQVKRAAAIALYTLERPSERAEEILRKTLKEAKSVDRWTAAQCLAYYGECDSEVVAELVYQMMHTEDNIRHERAGYLLAKLSENSTLVHSMLGEQLNSSSWRHRVMACKIMPKLSGNINKDLVHKLTHLMWTDWHRDVRKAAAQTLGKTGHGKDVHDQLLEKLIGGIERTRVEAVSKIGHLGIMTAKLMPAFLQCFSDSYVSVRIEACIACTNLKIKDSVILDKLIFLATYDPIWKVKALALQALGLIGLMDDKIRECILWAFRYEDNPGVRAEACHAVIVLGLRDTEVAQILQDRLLVETSNVVKDEITTALEMFGISATEDMDMVTQIKNEVRKLCTRNNVCAQITLNEAAEEKKANIERMIHIDPEQQEKTESSAPSQAQTRLSKRSQPSSAGPRATFTPESTGALSREGTMMTPIADQEIQALYTGDNGSESRPGTGYSSASSRIIMQSDSDSVSDHSETRSVATPRSRPLSMRPINEEEEEGEEKKPERKVVLGQTQSYVEVSGCVDIGSGADDIVHITHESPVTGSRPSSSMSSRFRTESSMSDVITDARDLQATAGTTIVTH